MECSLENITVHYELFGEGRPIIVLPGWGGHTRRAAYRMEPFFQQREGWKRIYIDPPGHGKTPGEDWVTDQDKMLKVILACIDKLTTGQRFSMVGISLGAYLARGVMLHRAEFIDGMAMIGLWTNGLGEPLPKAWNWESKVDFSSTNRRNWTF